VSLHCGIDAWLDSEVKSESDGGQNSPSYLRSKRRVSIELVLYYDNFSAFWSKSSVAYRSTSCLMTCGHGASTRCAKPWPLFVPPTCTSAEAPL
jgi:hypothetical protein